MKNDEPTRAAIAAVIHESLDAVMTTTVCPFAPGDTVTLRSGSCVMTVMRRTFENGIVGFDCAWFHPKTLEYGSANFSPESLDIHPPPPSAP